MQSHSLCRTIVEMVNRSAQKTNSGRNKKDVKKTDSRKLTLEALESRELLSVSPWLSDDLSSVQTQQSSEPIAPISLSDANPDLAENGWNVLDRKEDYVLELLQGKTPADVQNCTDNRLR